MGDTETIEYVDLYDSVQVRGKSLSDIAEEYNTSPTVLKEINPTLSHVREGIPLYYTTLYVPKYFGTLGTAGGGEHRIRANTLKPVIDQIKPKLYEILYRIQEFDERTLTLTREVNRNREANFIYTHYDVLNGINSNTFSASDAYTGYKREIFDSYEQSIKQLGMFFRHMTYLHHMFHLNRFFEIRQPGQLRKALIFTNQFLNVILARLDRLLFYLFHEYQMLNGSAQDWVIYQTLIPIINGSFGEINRYFSQEGDVSWFTLYGYNFFSFDVLDSLRWARFERGVDGVKISDEAIFDYSVDYEAKRSSGELENIRDILIQNLNEAADEGVDQFEERFTRAQTLSTGSLLENMEERIRETIKGVEEFLRTHPRSEELYKGKAARSYYNHGRKVDVPEVVGMGNYLDSLLGEAKRSLDEARQLFLSKSNWDSDLEQKVSRATMHFYCYHLGAVLFFLAGNTRQEIGNIETLFVRDEELFEDIRSRLAQLVDIAGISDINQAQSALSSFQEEVKPYFAQAEELIRKGNAWGAGVEMVFIIVLCVAVSVVATPMVGGALSAVFGTGSTAVAVGTFATEVLIFTIAPELLRSLDRGTSLFDGSIKKFGVSLASNALLFGCFRAVGKVVQGLVKVGCVTHPVAQYFLNSGFIFLTGTLVTAPLFAYELLQAGENPLEAGNEWGKFLLTHAVMSCTLALSSSVFKGVQARLESKAYKGVSQVRKARIETQWSKAQEEQEKLIQTLNDLKARYRSDFSLSRENYNNFKKAYTEAMNRPKELLKLLRQVRHDLIRLESIMSRQAGSFDPAPNGELILMEQSVVQMDAWLASMEYVPRMKYTLAIRAHEAIPNNGVDGLARIGADDGLYMGRVRVIFEQAAAIRAQDMEGNSLRIVRSPAAERFPQTRSIAIEALFSRGAIRDLTRITVLDVEGRTDMDSFPYDRPHELPEKTNELNTVPNQPDLAVLAVERYNNFHKLSRDGMIKAFNEGTPLSEAEREMYVRMIKAGRVVPEKLFRIQGDYDFAPKPIIYVADPFFFQGVNNQRVAKVLIGYPNNEDYLKQQAGERVLIFKNTRGAVVESNIENTREAWEEYGRWALEGPPVEITGVPLEHFNEFKKYYKKYFKKTENGRLIDKYSRSEMDRVWDEFSKLEPDENKIANLEADAKSRAIMEEKPELALIQNNPLWALTMLLDKYLSVNPLWTGKGFTATFTGRYGVREYLLKGPITIDELTDCENISIGTAFSETGE